MLPRRFFVITVYYGTSGTFPLSFRSYTAPDRQCPHGYALDKAVDIPAPGDTSVFRERGRTAGVCRVESRATGREAEIGIRKAGTSQTMLPPFAAITKFLWL